MTINQSYKTRESARATLNRVVRSLGLDIRNVEYEIKSIRGSGRFHPVVHQANGRFVKQIEAAGIIVTH